MYMVYVKFAQYRSCRSWDMAGNVKSFLPLIAAHVRAEYPSNPTTSRSAPFWISSSATLLYAEYIEYCKKKSNCSSFILSVFTPSDKWVFGNNHDLQNLNMQKSLKSANWVKNIFFSHCKLAYTNEHTRAEKVMLDVRIWIWSRAFSELLSI